LQEKILQSENQPMKVKQVKGFIPIPPFLPRETLSSFHWDHAAYSEVERKNRSYSDVLYKFRYV